MKPKNKRKMFFIISGCVLLTVLAVGVTFAYLNDRKTADNVFTVGDVYLKIEEPNYPEQESSRKMVAYSKVSKDPIIKNTGTNDEFVFMKVTVPLEEVTLITDGTKGEKQKQEIFNIISNDENKKTLTENPGFSYNSDWLYIESQTSGNTASYVFAYKKILLASVNTTADTINRVETEPLFDEVQLKGVLEGDILENALENIKIEAYGIQSDNMYGVPDLNVDSPTDDQLKEIYNIYVRQNGGTA